MRTALVTGAAGHLGGWVARTLLGEGFRVVGLDPRAPPADLASHPAFEAREGDVRHRDTVLDAAQGATAIFHLAMIHWTGREPAELVESVAKNGLLNVLEAVRRAPGTRLVYTSSAAAVGDTDDPDRPRDESSWNEAPATPYTRAKVETERLLWERAEGVDAVAVLPCMTIGPLDPGGAASNPRIEKMYVRARVPLYFDGGLNIVDVRDAARGHLLALSRGARGGRYLLGGENLTFRALAAELRALRGLDGPPSIRVPGAALVAAVAGYQIVSRATGRRTALTVTQVRHRLKRLAWFDCSRARRELGFTTRPLQESLRDLLAWSAGEGRIPEGLAPPARR